MAPLMKKPAPKSGTAMAAMLNLAIPTPAMIQPVRVVPILAPMMTPMPCLRVKRPALTKVMSITVVAEEDCTATVTRAPLITPMTLFLVMKLRVFCKRSPAAF